MSLRTLIVDDEPLARRGVRARLRAHRDIEVLAECRGGAEAIAGIEVHTPDLVFLDVQMPEVDGFSVLASIAAEVMPLVIFLTAYDQYAVRAFDVHALDYLLKPIDDERFVQALDRARSSVLLKDHQQLGARIRGLIEDHERQLERGYARRFAVRTGRQVTFVAVDDIDWIEALGDYAGLHVGAKTYLLRETIQVLETKLDPQEFVRIHRSSIVRIERVREIEAMPNRDAAIRLKTGAGLRVSRTYIDQFRARLR